MPKPPRTTRTTGKRKKTPATLRSTSGAGFDFEDLISAWLMVKMLAGEPSPATGGNGVQLQAQVSAMGWHVDDLLLVSQNPDGMARLAISAKGNVQVTAAGFPEEFVERVWTQWRDPAGLMDRRQDHLALVTRAPHPVFDPAWYEIKNACEGSDNALAVARISGNPNQRRVFESVLKAAPRPADGDAIELIRHLHVIPLDLHADHSETRGASVTMLRRLLTTGDAHEAENLWNFLVEIAGDIRTKRGTLTLQELWSSLRPKFSLKDHPDYASDWNTLAGITSDNKDRIETTLPSSHALKRSDETERVLSALREHPVLELSGESGSGKSALLKCIADEHLADWSHVWVQPEDLRDLLSARRRPQLPLRHPLEQVLGATAKPRNLLVIDSAERIPPDEQKAVRQLVETLVPPAAHLDSLWRVVIVSQSSDGFFTARRVHREQLGALAPSEVKDAVRSTGRLSWLVAHGDTIDALTNLKTLAWVIQANLDVTDAAGPAHYAMIADRLWSFWTNDQHDVQVLAMQLALKEADFQRSFPVSEMGVAELSAFKTRPAELPLRVTRLNRIEFEHDLAADLARFQWLKQYASEPARWTHLAGNPLWSSALRMLGQFLLREPSGSRTGWDDALDAADATGPSTVGNLLLDALCLDPEAERFLAERSDLLFENTAAYLQRLLKRFAHIATVPRGVTGGDAPLGIHMDARFRMVTVGRWLPMLRYLAAQRNRLNGVVSVALAELIEMWLTQLPREGSNGQPIPFRRELAHIALDMARTVQAEKASGVMYIDSSPSLYTAPLSAIGDLPDEIGTWALEMSGRRKRDAGVETRVTEARRAQEVTHTQRMATSPEYKRRHDAARRIPPTLSSIREHLSPWPLGPQLEVERSFRDACLQRGLHHVVAIDPVLATELVLALIIEESPEREDMRDYHDPNLGLEAARDGYPTAFWKSPFLTFLAMSADAALSALAALVEFCTSRWADQIRGAQTITLAVPGQPSRDFIGDGNVLGWGQASSHRNGHMYSALDALEYWLTLQIDADVDVTPIVERLLRETHSVAMLGVLCNVAKYRPALLAGPLAPLLTSPKLYFWDAARVKSIAYSFQGHQWLHYGESIFQAMKRWVLAPRRRTSLAQVAVDSVLDDSDLATWLKATISNWAAPADPKEHLELKALRAQLDADNYPARVPLDRSSREFVMPPDVQAEIDDWGSSHAPTVQVLTLPRQCEQRLQQGRALSEDECAFLYSELTRYDSVPTIEEDFKERARLAVAATLLVLGGEWLDRSLGAREKAEAVVSHAVAAVDSDDERSAAMRFGATGEDLKFAAVAIVGEWIRTEGDPAWERLLLRLLTSFDRGGTPAVVAECYKHRDALRASWWRLLEISVMWAALASLSPRYGDHESTGRRWSGWRERLIGLPVWKVDATIAKLRVRRLAEGVHRLDYRRQLRAFSQNGDRLGRKPEKCRGPGLDTLVLESAFGWLLEASGTGNWSVDVELTARLWAHEVDWARRKSERDSDLDLPGDGLGYDVVRALAHLAASDVTGLSKAAWQPVMELGPAAERAVHHFINSLFLELLQGADPLHFEEVWSELLDYALSPHWQGTASVYRAGRLVGELLGFGHESALERLTAQVAVRHANAYEHWAERYLEQDDDCIVGLSTFVASDVGSAIRPTACVWVAAALDSADSRRDRVGPTLIDLCNVALSKDAALIVKDETYRRSLLRIAEWLAIHNSGPAMVLQEQIRKLRTLQ